MTLRLTASVALAVVIAGVCRTEPLAAQAAVSALKPPTYNQLVSGGYDLLKEGLLPQAYTAATRAAAMNASRFEAYALAALVLHARGEDGMAKEFVDKALAKSPAAKKASVNEIARLVGTDARRQLDALLLITKDADQAKTPEMRRPLLVEFMIKSSSFVAEYPSEANVWLARAAICLELDYSRTGWVAALNLRRLRLDTSTDPRTRRIMAQLERKGWFGAYSQQRPGLVDVTTEQLFAAARSGDAEAQAHLGLYYMMGNGVPQDASQEFAWSFKAAQQGQPVAIGIVVAAYELGEGVTKDDVQRAAWLRTGAQQGIAEFQSGLGEAFGIGRGVPQSFVEAHAWYLKAANQDYAYAQMLLARDLATNPDPSFRQGAEAVRWAERASAQGVHSDYFDTLAVAYAENGQWTKAVEAEERALTLARADPQVEKATIDEMTAQLELFKRQQPYRRTR